MIYMTKNLKKQKQNTTNTEKKTTGKFTYNELGMSLTEDGELKNINFNIFVKYLLEKYKIVIDDSKNYYFYSKQYNFWLKADISDICRIARKIMHKFKNDICRPNLSMKSKRF